MTEASREEVKSLINRWTKKQSIKGQLRQSCEELAWLTYERGTRVKDGTYAEIERLREENEKYKKQELRLNCILHASGPREIVLGKEVDMTYLVDAVKQDLARLRKDVDDLYGLSMVIKKHPADYRGICRCKACEKEYDKMGEI